PLVISSHKCSSLIAPSALPFDSRVGAISPQTTNPRLFSLYAFSCSHNELAYYFRAANRIRHITDSQSREYIGSVQGYISSLFNGCSHVHTIGFQPRKKSDSVCLGHDNNNRVPTFQSGFDKASIAIYQRSIVCVEHNLMAMYGHRSMVVHRCAGIMTHQTGLENPFAMKNGFNSRQ